LVRNVYENALLFTASLALTHLAVPAFGQSAETAVVDPALDEIIVAGTRLSVGDPSARVDVMTFEDIRARGLSTIEDILRAIPQNFIGFGNFSNNEQLFSITGLSAGTQLANLRGLGSENTLVLVNGRRRAGIAGNDSGYANLANIPASMIERVEILLGGGSAVYGSDAIGGVINIITRKNYSGLSVRGRYDESSTGGDKWTADITAGFSWETGSISGTLSHQDVDVVRNARTGWTTSDYRDRFDANPERFIGNRDDYDNRNDSVGQPGWVRLPDFTLVSLPLDNDGVGALPFDFVDISDPVDRANFRNDDVPEFSGTESETTSFNGAIYQEIGTKLGLRSEWDWSRVDSWKEQASAGDFFSVPASNAYNPFGEEVPVNYLPSFETANGLLPNDFDTTVNEIVNVNIGFDYAFRDTLRLGSTFVFSESAQEGSARRFLGNTSGVDELADFEAHINAILENSDAGQTVNLFGNGSAQTNLISEFFAESFDRDNRTQLEQLDAQLAGEFSWLPAGPINFVFGGEIRTEKLVLPSDSVNLLSWTGGATPERRSRAIFAELSVPLIGEPNAARLARQLTLNLQARYDSYSQSGADGSDEDGDPNIIEARFSAVSPRVALAYKPVDALVLRTSWSRAFRAPTFNRLFDATPFPEVFATLPFLRFFDPLAPGGPAEVRTGVIRRGNPDLEPERSEQWDVGFTWAPESVPELSVSVDYSHIDYKDRIVSGGAVIRDLPPEVVAPRSDLIIRDADGNAVTQVFTPINEYRRVSEDLAVDIKYRHETRWGMFEPGINFAKVTQLHDQYSPDTEPVDLVGTSRGLDNYRIRSYLGWVRDNWSAMLGINHTPSYLNNQVAIVFGGPVSFHKVSSYTTADLTIAVGFNSGLTVRVGGRNITDAAFPFAALDNQIAGGRPYDPSRVDPYGRVLFLDLTYETN